MQILIIDGHPDARPGRFIHALAAAYRDGAEAARHEVRTLDIGALEFPLLPIVARRDAGCAPSAAFGPSGRM